MEHWLVNWETGLITHGPYTSEQNAEAALERHGLQDTHWIADVHHVEAIRSAEAAGVGPL